MMLCVPTRGSLLQQKTPPSPPKKKKASKNSEIHIAS